MAQSVKLHFFVVLDEMTELLICKWLSERACTSFPNCGSGNEVNAQAAISTMIDISKNRIMRTRGFVVDKKSNLEW